MFVDFGIGFKPQVQVSLPLSCNRNVDRSSPNHSIILHSFLFFKYEIYIKISYVYSCWTLTFVAVNRDTRKWHAKFVCICIFVACGHFHRYEPISLHWVSFQTQLFFSSMCTQLNPHRTPCLLFERFYPKTTERIDLKVVKYVPKKRARSLVHSWSVGRIDWRIISPYVTYGHYACKYVRPHESNVATEFRSRTE